ncbi:MAG TPA: ATP-binding protein, partial [Alphaproteobacteria bacterium]|nr:ATP-binding protein [Alphaproteobacteria bacterium]
LDAGQRDHHGNLSGRGAVDPADAGLMRELAMALALNPLFHSAKLSLPDAAWVYYTSARGFINIMPWVPSTDFHYTDALLAKSFFTGGTPAANPQRRRFWTEAYIDEYGQGLMVTAAAPVYEGAEFRGTVAVDVTLKALSDFLRARPLVLGEAFIANADRQLLAHPRIIRPDDTAIRPAASALPEALGGAWTALEALPADSFHALDGHIVRRLPLAGAPWTLVYSVEEPALRWSVLGSMGSEFAAAGLVLLALLAVERRRRSQMALEASDRALQDRLAELEAAHAKLQTQSQALAQARDAARAASAAKSQFLANVSHELRTPLNAVIGFSEVMLREVLGPLGSARYREYAEDIHTSGRHLLEIINDLIDLARIEAGRTELRVERFDLPPLLDECFAVLRERAARDAIAVNMAVPARLPALLADRRLVKQILLNLMGNAVKFSPPGRDIAVTVTADAEGLAIAIADRGPGIPLEAQAHIFTPFSRGEAAVRNGREGSGLGLAISKSLAELHGGRIDLESAPGCGTTVTIRLPATRLETAAPDQAVA